MLNKVNVVPIFLDHLRTLRTYPKNNLDWIDIFIFFFVPIISTGAFLYLRTEITAGMLQTLITFFAVMFGFKFNVLVILISYRERVSDSVQSLKSADHNDELMLRKTKLLKLSEEVSSNTLYGVLISIFCIIYLLLLDMKILSLGWLATAFILVFLTHYVLTLFMILKRLRVIITHAHSS